MTEELKAHEMSTSMVKAPPAEVEGGTEVQLKVRVACSSACDLWGRTVRIITEDGGVVREVVLLKSDGTANETEEFLVRTPFKPGDYTWMASFPTQGEGGALHEESSVSFSFEVKEHAIGVSVWDVPSSVTMGGDFRIKVGVECSSECVLAGQKIEIHDHEGAVVATGTLPEEVWCDTAALYWTEVALNAPSAERRYRWTVQFPQPDLEIQHTGASCTFAFATGREADHVLTIEVTDKETKAPVEGARVLLRANPYRGSKYVGQTDEGGVASVSVPKGEYQLYVDGGEKVALLPAVKVDGDSMITAEIASMERGWLTF